MTKTPGDRKKSVGRLINELSRSAHIYFQHEFRKYAIGHAQIRTLLYISHHDGLTQKEIATHLNLDKSSITSQLQILEGNGYIKRNASDKDARMQEISITDKTRQLLPSLTQVLSSWSKTLLQGFTAEEETDLFNYLMRLQNNAEAKLRLMKGMDKT